MRRRAATLAGGYETTIQIVGTEVQTFDGLSTPISGRPLTFLTPGLDTEPSEGDLIIIGYSLADNGNRSLSIKDAVGTDYTLAGSELYANDSRDANLRVAYKFAGASPDTTFQQDDGLSGAGGAGSNQILVLRGVDQSTPLDVSVVTATGTNTGRPDPGSITPVTPGAVIVCFAMGTLATGEEGPDFTSSDFDFFEAANRDGSSKASVCSALGYSVWQGGAFDPAQFGGGSTSSSDSWAAVMLAIRAA